MLRITKLAAFSLLCAVAPATAQDAVSGAEPAATDPTATETSVVTESFSDSQPITETDLDGITGREDRGTSIAAATQRNTVSANSVSGNSVTGAVTIDGNAFQNLQGMAVISANSGNNVAINSAMNVVINLGGPQ